ncbi:hypothetical protein MCOR27_005664 [Pyricularia oryzae]|uniref:Ureidoglycolate hydrolase n=4 Tax=Pyricularia TaxID=48558 RepID=A0ABQ8NYE1_PYRGI|nr:uncharacterized protein MGG_08107 [Pyricularia oryzae 70-15]ELQ44229.1 hypothetical protein OOU_Y34scaffold00094g19 [Pyricularia oryzae Y34]KAH8839467.1 hypothetical protein MCOR01_008666 [Pyricularia oryzae]KAI6303935.1 hypothetical protein MCOR33_000919 [Pyricularia grisea]EHA55256.1 hypothetical protein MGG_08107 [Pyricularia oryzae 70-15]KAH9439320.1 hypothetical protein MCOR02_002882 [Pyricularia oryzae]
MLVTADSRNKLEDLSGIVLQPGENPYNALIKACNGREAEIQSLYSTHRTARNEQQKQKFLVGFNEVITDPILMRLEDPTLEPGFQDPRNCLVLWARPPGHVLELASHLQHMLKQAAPNLWLMPTHRMHMTAMEITHSRTPEEISALVATIRLTTAKLANYSYTHRSRVVKPMIVYDLAGVALSFVPAAGEPLVSSDRAVYPFGGDGKLDDGYSYHHLRRDVWDMVRTDAGVEVGSRYVVPSAHITLGRYLTQEDHATPDARERWVQNIDEINAWLAAEVWTNQDERTGFVGEWLVGQERGLDLRAGRLWYGAGRTIMTGEGF